MLGLQSQQSKTLRVLKIVNGKVAWITTNFRGITPVKIVLFLHCAQFDNSQAHNALALQVKQYYFLSWASQSVYELNLRPNILFT